MSRRSTRLSSTLSSTSSAAASASASGSGSAGGSASAARSSPSLPAASATRRRTGAGKERRFEDILADAGGDETMDVGAESAFVHQVQPQVQKKKEAVKRKAEEPKEKGRVRGPRKTYGEEKGEDDFIFSRAAPSAPVASSTTASTSGARGASKTSRRGIPGALGAPPSSDGVAMPSSDGSRFSSRTRMEPLPLEEETPIIRRNQALRAGLSSSAAAAASGSSFSGARDEEASAPVRRRRDSMGLKTTRRVSALSNGALAHPHESVPFSELFRHASTSLSDAQRMRTLLAWILRRGVERAKRGEWEVGKGKRRVGMKEGEKERVKGMEEELGEVMRKTLEELERGKIDVDWSSRTRAASGSSSAVHPRNVTNAATATRLEGVVGSMAREVSRWEAEEREIEAFEAETAWLVSALEAGEPAPAALASAEEWEEQDLDEDAKRAYSLATHTLAGEATWLEERRRGSSKSAAPAQGVSEDVKAVEAEIRRLASQAGSSNDEDTQGTARDKRFGELEFNVDRLHSLSHSYAQLSSLAARYVSAISLRAASALQAQRAPSSAAGGSAASSSAPAGAEEAHVESAGGAAARSREDVERLLARLAREVEEGQEREEEENVAEESAADLLAALVGKRR